MDTTSFLSNTALCTSGRLLVMSILHDAEVRKQAEQDAIAQMEAGLDVVRVVGEPFRWPLELVRLAPPSQAAIDSFVKRCAAVGLGPCTPEQAAELLRKPDTLPKLERLEKRVAVLRKPRKKPANDAC